MEAPTMSILSSQTAYWDVAAITKRFTHRGLLT